jgi:hypothetical protein
VIGIELPKDDGQATKVIPIDREPLFVYSAKHVLTSLATSSLDPNNNLAAKDVLASNNLLQIPRSKLAELMCKAPLGEKRPTAFPRLVSASPSGNVNSKIVLNFWTRKVRNGFEGMPISVLCCTHVESSCRVT